MPAHKLLLHPQDIDFHLPVRDLAAPLQAIGLIGPPRQLGEGRFYPVGEHFLHLVTFLGCSPAIELDPPAEPDRLASASASGAFCHVLLESGTRPRLRHDPRTPPARCPHCREPLPNWTGLCASARLDPVHTVWKCPACGHSGDFTRLRLRKSAAVASCWVEIRGIYPSEAVAGDTLLHTLHALGGGHWQTVYLQEPALPCNGRSVSQ